MFFKIHLLVKIHAETKISLENATRSVITANYFLARLKDILATRFYYLEI